MTDDLNGAAIIDTNTDLDTDTDVENLEYLLALIAHRCPELGPDDLASVTQPDDEPLGEWVPVEVLDQVVDVMTAIVETRMERLEAKLQTSADIIGNVWRQMQDHPIEAKVAMLKQLEGLVELEASTHATLN